MRKLYYKYFHISKEEKIADTVMTVRVVMAAFCIVFCLAAMSLTAYAYFTYNVTSSLNTIQTGKFEMSVAVSEGEAPLELTTIEEGMQQGTAFAGKTYTVTITPGGTGATGFCIVTVGDKTYYTQQLGKDYIAENQSTPSMTFTLQTSEDMTITFASHWGTSSYYDAYSNKGENEELYITNGETIEVLVQ